MRPARQRQPESYSLATEPWRDALGCEFLLSPRRPISKRERCSAQPRRVNSTGAATIFHRGRGYWSRGGASYVVTTPTSLAGSSSSPQVVRGGNNILESLKPFRISGVYPYVKNQDSIRLYHSRLSAHWFFTQLRAGGGCSLINLQQMQKSQSRAAIGCMSLKGTGLCGPTHAQGCSAGPIIANRCKLNGRAGRHPGCEFDSRQRLSLRRGQRHTTAAHTDSPLQTRTAHAGESRGDASVKSRRIMGNIWTVTCP